MSQVMNDTTLIVQNTPQDLRSRRQWVCWRYETSKTGNITKVPYDPRSGTKASASNPTTWCTFEQTVEAYANSDYNGVGYVFSGSDGMAGLDLDDCIREDGSIEPWARQIVEGFQTYAEISPSERGLKLFLRGRKPLYTGCSVKDMGGGSLEIYDRNRYFCVTGNRWPGSPADVTDQQAELTALCNHFWNPSATPIVSKSPSAPPAPVDDCAADCLASMLATNMSDKGDGSMRLYTAACRCVEHDLSDAQAITTIRAYGQVRPFPTDWTDRQIIQRIRDAEKRCRRGEARNVSTDNTIKPEFKTVAQLLTDYPELRRPVIHDLLRQGETMNIIASSKTGKSWLALDLAFSVATGRRWLDRFPTAQGDVLILDNELHGETLSNRIPKVAAARGIALPEIAESVVAENLRGRLKDLLGLGEYFRHLEPGRFKIIILDAFYRFMPPNTDENDNATMAMLYNYLDRYARDLGCCFVLIHHATKGSQSGKAVTDVGAGAGSQSRAWDSHLVLRPHEEEGVVVLDAAVRSWKPVEPLCLRWTFPVWTQAPELDPTALRPERARRQRRRDNEPQAQQVVQEQPKWDVDKFVSTFVAVDGRQADTIIGMAIDKGMSQAAAKRLLAQSVDAGKVHRWTSAANKPVRFSTQTQPLIKNVSKASRT